VNIACMAWRSWSRLPNSLWIRGGAPGGERGRLAAARSRNHDGSLGREPLPSSEVV
jgi:hypothetical protein